MALHFSTDTCLQGAEGGSVVGRSRLLCPRSWPAPKGQVSRLVSEEKQGVDVPVRRPRPRRALEQLAASPGPCVPLPAF